MDNKIGNDKNEKMDIEKFKYMLECRLKDRYIDFRLLWRITLQAGSLKNGKGYTLYKSDKVIK